MEDVMNVVPTETVVEVTEEATKQFDGEAFAMGAAGGAAAAVGIYLLVKKLVVPGFRKLKVKIDQRKAAKEAELESDGFEEVSEE